MYLKYFLLLLTTFVGFTAKSQILLNVDSSKISKTVGLQGGRLYQSTIEKDSEINGYYQKMVFRFPIPPEGNSSLMNMTFYLTLKNKCFKIDGAYWGRDLADKRIDELSQPLQPLYRVKRANGQLKWTNLEKGFEVSLIPDKIGNNTFASVYHVDFQELRF